MSDPLDQIFTNEKEIDPQLLADMLKPYLKISTDNNAMIYTDLGSDLPLSSKIILFLLVRKALKFRDKIKEEEISPAEIIDKTSLKGGSVHPTLKSLREHGLVISKSGKYFIPNYQLAKIKNTFNLGGENGS